MRDEKQMVAVAKEKVLSSTLWITADGVASRSGLDAKNIKSLLQTWEREKRIFCVYHRGASLFPIYAFDQKNSWMPNKMLGLIIKAFENQKSSWAMAIWLAGANGFLAGARPQDLLDSYDEALIKAVSDELAGITHG